MLVFGDGVSSSAALRPGDSLVIGRDAGAAISVAHPSVSREHAVLRRDGAVTLEDLGSKNATRVGARVLARGERVPLPVGVIAQVGAVSMVVQGPEISLAPPPARLDPDERDHTLLLHGFLADSAPLVDRLAASSLSVLLLGETGVGKDALAEHMHARSPRRHRPLLRLHCAALSESLLESELFGHEKGAFTGATRRRVGLLEGANGGTVFLDEVGELPGSVQVKLLRVLEDRRVTRVGGAEAVSVDVRFIAATHRDLEGELGAGTFREDLFFRLSGATLHLPPLRERTSEILPLAAAFLSRASGGARSRAGVAAPRLLAHRWPGNIRELRNVMERAAALTDGPEVHATDLHFDAAEQGADGEAARIRAALRACSGNQTRAAALLGVSRRTLIHRLDALGFPRPRK